MSEPALSLKRRPELLQLWLRFRRHNLTADFAPNPRLTELKLQPVVELRTYSKRLGMFTIRYPNKSITVLSLRVVQPASRPLVPPPGRARPARSVSAQWPGRRAA